METPALPRTLGELDAWRVYADALLERGDRLGRLLSVDLNLSAAPSVEQLRAFQHLAVRRCRNRTFAGAEWILGFARTIFVRPDLRVRKLSRSRPLSWAVSEALAAAAELVLTEPYQRVEALSLGLGRASLGRMYDRLMSRLPPSCTRLELETAPVAPEELRAVAPALPQRFDTLRLTSFDESVLERLGAKVTTLELAVALGEHEARRLESVAPECTVIASGATAEAARRLGSRLRLGRPGDAVLFDLESGAACAVNRVRVDLLQRTFGILGAQAQLARTIPETWSLLPLPRAGVGLEAVPFRDTADLMRHAEGRWTVSTTLNPNTRITVDGADVRSPIAIDDGAVVRVNGAPWRFSIVAS